MHRVTADYFGSARAARDHPWLPQALRASRSHEAKMLTAPNAFCDDGSECNHGVVLCPSPCPHATSLGTRHDLLWMADGTCWSDAEIDAQIRPLLAVGTPFVWFDDPVRSVTHGRLIRYVHVLWRTPSLPTAPVTDTVDFVCSDGPVVGVPAHLLRALAPVWRDVHAKSFLSHFDSRNVIAVVQVARSMAHEEGVECKHVDLARALPVAWAHGICGMVRYALARLTAHEAYESVDDERAVQKIIVWCDQHKFELPLVVRMRMMKTLIGSQWVGVPYMWKVSTDSSIPGFPLTQLRNALLLGLKRLSVEQSEGSGVRMSPVDVVLRNRYTRRWKARLRARARA